MTTSADSLGWCEPEAASARIGLLYEAHGEMVVGLCRFLLRDPIEAEDAAQQAFVAAHRSLLRGSIPRDAPAWLATIARNECRARINQRMREPLPLIEPDGTQGHLSDPFHTAVENADLEALRFGLQALPTAQRSAFVLREFAGLSYNELARALEVTEPAVESLLVRARRRLRLALAQANSLAIPVVLRDQLALLTATGDDGSVSSVAKVASLPFAAKLAAAGTGAVLAVAGGAGVAGLSDRHRETPTRRAAAVTTPVAPETPVALHKTVAHPAATRPILAAPRRNDVRPSGEHRRGGTRGHDGTGTRSVPSTLRSGEDGGRGAPAAPLSDGDAVSTTQMPAVQPPSDSQGSDSGSSGSGNGDASSAAGSSGDSGSGSESGDGGSGGGGSSDGG